MLPFYQEIYKENYEAYKELRERRILLHFLLCTLEQYKKCEIEITTKPAMAYFRKTGSTEHKAETRINMRIAQVVGKLSSAGVEAVVNNYYRHMDHSKIQFDYIIDNDSDYTSSEEMVALGARYFVVPPTRKLFARIKTLEKLFKENHYQIVHSHMNTLNAPVLYSAKKAGVPIRISHNHSSADWHDPMNFALKQLLKPTGKWFATDYMACGEKAGEWLFGKAAYQTGKVFVLFNAIDTKKYSFNPSAREEIRKRLQIDSGFVIGHVGRFVKQKNHAFLILLFSEIKKRRPEARLLLVGDGPLRNETESIARQFSVLDSVRFVGNKKNTADYYSAMDLFVLPSLYEGLPVVGLEAQANNLPCLFSLNVSQETKVEDNVEFLPLDIKIWVEKTEQAIDNNIRKPTSKAIIGSLFDLNVSGKKLEEFYDFILARIESTDIDDKKTSEYMNQV